MKGKQKIAQQLCAKCTNNSNIQKNSRTYIDIFLTAMNISKDKQTQRLKGPISMLQCNLHWFLRDIRSFPMLRKHVYVLSWPPQQTFILHFNNISQYYSIFDQINAALSSFKCFVWIIPKFWLVVYEPPTPIQTLNKTEKLRNSWNMACINPRC